MDDYSIASLTESKNEWCARLVTLLTHNIVVGVNSIFNEAVKLCNDLGEENKYLMTFQNLLSTIPAWNPTTIETERKRIEQESGCKYLEELITCVHIIQLKALTCIRVGQKQKKIDIDIPSIDKFIHQIYINTARKLYTNIYLFERDLYPLQVQKNNRELEILVKEAILITIRDNIPVDRILQCYMEESEVVEVQNNVPTPNEKVSPDTLANKIPIDLSQNAALTETKLDQLAANLNEQNSPLAEEPQLVETLSKEIKPSESISELPASLSQLDTILSTDPTSVPTPIAALIAAPVATPLAALIAAPVVAQVADSLSIDFSNKDTVFDKDGKQSDILAPKDLKTLEHIAEVNQAKRNEENEGEDRIEIGDDITLDITPISLD
jgi:hypothetical protein